MVVREQDSAHFSEQFDQVDGKWMHEMLLVNPIEDTSYKLM
jgi:hypothetical protein